VHVDAAEDGTATSQKPLDSRPWANWLANGADQESGPTAPRLLDLDHSELHRPMLLTRSNNEPLGSAQSTGPHPRYNTPSPPPSPGFSWPSQLAADNPRPPSPDFSWPSQLPANNLRPQSPDFSWPSQLPANNPRPQSPDVSWPSHLSANNHPESSGFSWPDHLPAASSLPPKSDTSPSHQSAGDYPPSSSESPHPTEPETKDLLSQLDRPVPSHPTEPETKNFLDLLLKGRIKRRISGSDAVNSE
jgi:hypothetical protein